MTDVAIKDKKSMQFYTEIDGMSFSVEQAWVKASGWQGRYLEFSTADIDSLIVVLKRFKERLIGAELL